MARISSERSDHPTTLSHRPPFGRIRRASFAARILLPSLLLASAFVGCVTTAVTTTEASAEVQLPDYDDELVEIREAKRVVEERIPEPDIVEWPITYDEERARLTVAFLEHRRGGMDKTGDVWADASIIPRMVVLHHTAGPTAQSAYNTFQAVKDRRRGLKDHQKVNLSTHFIIDRDGTIYRLFDETLAGRHTIGLNHVAIGVENVGGIKGYELTDAQVEANVELISYLKAKHPTITHVIGHHEYRQMEGHAYFDEADPKFRTVKIDPGREFMGKVRRGIKTLAVSGPPGSDTVASVP